MLAGDVNQTWANVEHLKADYDYQPSTALEVGVEAFVDWYKSYYSQMPKQIKAAYIKETAFIHLLI